MEDNEVKQSFESKYYRENFSEFVANYWVRKLWSMFPNFTAFNIEGEVVEKAQQRHKKILNDTDWPTFIARYVHTKSKQGNVAIIVNKVIGANGKPTIFFNVANGIVKYSRLLGADRYVQVIENIMVGTVPLIKMMTYGTHTDTISYDIDKSELNKINDNKTKKEVNKLLKLTQRIVHNNGFVRALVSVNRPTNEEYSFGRSDTFGFEELLEGLDETRSRMLLEIAENGGHYEANYGLGSNQFGGDDDGSTQSDDDFAKLKEEYEKSIYQKRKGTVRFVYRNIQTENGVDADYIPADLNIDKLRQELKEQKRELYQELGMSVDYDADGKTNDTNSKVDKKGDTALQEATLRKNQEAIFWTKVWSVVSQLDEQEYWSEVETIDFIPRLNDFRLKVEVIQHLDKMIKIFPVAKIIEMIDDVSPYVANKFVEDKEDNVKKSVVEYLAIGNGNLPQNMKLKDLEWAEEVEQKEETPQEQQDNGEE